MGGKSRPLFYQFKFWGTPIQYLITPLFSIFFGLCIGSFLNVCLFRWKNGGQIFTPPSFCPKCKNEIRWFDNIPLLSFFLLKGHCRFCKESISWQYPLIEAVAGLLFWFSAFNDSGKLMAQVYSFVFVSFLILLVVSDLKWKLLPHPFTNFFAMAGLIFQAIDKSFNLAYFYAVTSGFVLIGVLIFALTQIFPNVLGGGDIKMILALSIWFGVAKSVYILVLAFGIGAIVAVVLLATKKINRKSTMSFGPFLALGAFSIWFWPNLFDYLRMVL
jgi:prepilin signal peptidase PulO-like enzyme (type II secretory pathway)